MQGSTLRTELPLETYQQIPTDSGEVREILGLVRSLLELRLQGGLDDSKQNSLY
jgi:hypothetical protein